MDNNYQKPAEEPKQISFRKLVFEALPEMWSFQWRTTLFMLLVLQGTGILFDLIINSSGTAFTTANLWQSRLCWRMPAAGLLGACLALMYVTAEVLAQI